MIFSSARKIQFLILLLLLCVLIGREVYAFEHHDWNALLKAHVKEGEVDYQGFQSSFPQLVRYLQSVENYPIALFSEDSREERLALWINVYNASAIHFILKHYPVRSIDEIKGFFDGKSVLVAGMAYSLREVREEVIRKGFRDERALIALVSGMRSSGPLRAEAYEGGKLLDQLRDQAQVFLTDERYNRIHAKAKKINLSPIFREFADEFILGYGTPEADGRFSSKEIAVLAFLRIHIADEEVRAWLDGRRFKISYLPEDRSLNEVRETK